MKSLTPSWWTTATVGHGAAYRRPEELHPGLFRTGFTQTVMAAARVKPLSSQREKWSLSAEIFPRGSLIKMTEGDKTLVRRRRRRKRGERHTGET